MYYLYVVEVMRLFLFANVASLTSGRITTLYIVISSLFVALVTMYFRVRSLPQYDAAILLRETRIAAVNAYVLHVGNDGIFLFTNVFKGIMKNVCFGIKNYISNERNCLH